jgi:solute carrier family 35 (UDP-galactose transporter), member B1
LTWGFLQERITTTDYAGSRFKFPVFLNTVQSFIAALTGYAYLFASTKHPHRAGPLPVFPSRRILYLVLAVAFTSSLASPFGYASLAHIDYITFILAKSCKLIPVMLLHTTVFRKRYPLYKYLVVLAVTLGVAVFTLHHPGEATKASKHKSKAGAEGRNVPLGLLLLGINLLLDGLTNSVQDHIFQKFKSFSPAQMMCAMNVMSTSLTACYLTSAPYVASTFVGEFLGMKGGDELSKALAFVRAHPSVGYDVVAFGVCGALGQVAICTFLLEILTQVCKMLTPPSQSIQSPTSPPSSSSPSPSPAR